MYDVQMGYKEKCEQGVKVEKDEHKISSPIMRLKKGKPQICDETNFTS